MTMTTRSTDSANILLHYLQIHTHSEYFTVYTMIRNSDEVLEKLCKYVCKKKVFSKKTDRIYSGVYYQRLSATLSPAAVYSKIVNVS